MDPRAFWTDYAGPGWALHADELDALLQPLHQVAVRAADPRAGERALDIGCGCGGTTIDLARAVGSAGQVVGVDLSAPMLARARARAADAGTSWATFLEADVVEGADLPADTFDLAYSRMALMLLADQVRGLRNVRNSLRRGGRLCATVFRAATDNPWLPVVVLGAAPYVGALPPLPLGDAPGPFAFADPDRVRRILAAAGFTDVRIDPFDAVLRPPDPPEAAAELLIELGPASGAYRRSPSDRQAEARAAVATLIERYRNDRGRLELPSGGWLLTAR